MRTDTRELPTKNLESKHKTWLTKKLSENQKAALLRLLSFQLTFFSPRHGLQTNHFWLIAPETT